MVTKEEIFKAVSTVNDPEVGFNLVEMGLIYDASSSLNDDNEEEVIVTMTLSTKACPLHQMIVQWVEEAVIRELPSVSKATAEVVWEPAWNITMATEEVQAKLAGGM
jgi:metal-sulfur cluster biosynthetic enzyme